MTWRAALPLVWIASSGCASALQRSAEAYERGDFRAAHELLAWVEPGEGEELRAAVAAGIDYSTSYLLSQARAVFERGRSKPYLEALAYYRAALAVMPSGHPRRADVRERAAVLERGMAAARGRAAREARRFGAAARARDYRAAVDSVGTVVELTRSAGDVPLDPGDVLALAGKAMGDGEHDTAVQLIDLADRVRREARAPSAAEVSEIARVTAALRYFRSTEETDPATVTRPSRRRRRPPPQPRAETEPDPAGDREANAHLERARRRWQAGEEHEALRILDDALVLLGDRPSLE